MKCTIWVNKTLDTQPGTILSDLHLVFKFITEYSSQVVTLKKLAQAVEDAYHKQAQKFKYTKGIKLGVQLSSKAETQNYLYLKDSKSIQLLQQYDENNINPVRSHCDIFVEAIPIVNMHPNGLLQYFIDAIPFDMIENDEIDYNAIEWNDFDGLIIEYCIISDTLYWSRSDRDDESNACAPGSMSDSHTIYTISNVASSDSSSNSTSDSTVVKHERFKFHHIFQDMLDQLCCEVILRFLQEISNCELKWHQITCVYDHLLYLWNLYRTHEMDNLNDEYLILLAFYTRRHKLLYCQLQQNSHCRYDDSHNHRRLMSLLLSKTIIKQRLAVVATNVQPIEQEMICHGAYFKLLDIVSKFCQIGQMNVAGDCLAYFFDQFKYSENETRNLTKFGLNELVNLYNAFGINMRNPMVRRATKMARNPGPDGNVQWKIFTHCVQFILHFLIILLIYCNNLSLNCLLRFRIIVNNIFSRHVAANTPKPKKCMVHLVKGCKCTFEGLHSIASFLLSVKMLTQQIYLWTIKNNNGYYSAEYMKQKSFKTRLTRLPKRYQKMKMLLIKMKQQSRDWSYDQQWLHLTNGKFLLYAIIKTQSTQRDILDHNYNYNCNHNCATLSTDSEFNVTDIIDSAVQMSLTHCNYHDKNGTNSEYNAGMLNGLEEFVSKLQLGCLSSGDENEVFLQNGKLVAVISPNMRRVVTSWRHVAGMKECQTCKIKYDSLRKCKKCKKLFFCSKKCQKIDWKRNKVHRKQCSR